MAGIRVLSRIFLRDGTPLLRSGRGFGAAESFPVRRRTAWKGECIWMLRSARMSYSSESYNGHNMYNPYMKQRCSTLQPHTTEATGSFTFLSNIVFSEQKQPRPLVLVLTAKTRSAMEEAADKFLYYERRWLYAIYRPSSHGGDSVAPSPHEYVQVLERLTACGMGTIAKRIYLVLVELLKKPLHPSQVGEEWDLPDEAMVNLQATALAAVMSALDGENALMFAQKCIMPFLSSSVTNDKKRTFGVFLYTMHQQLSGGGSSGNNNNKNTSPRLVDMNGGNIEGRVLMTAPVVAAVAAALIRCNTTLEKQQSVELLQLASIARLRGINVFDENVAEKCAESAALIGDAETVTRIIFILYRMRGVLGQSVIPENSKSGIPTGDGMNTCDGRVTRISLWGRVAGSLGLRASTEKRDKGSADLAFRWATVRLLKSVIHAVLYRSGETESQISLATIREAIKLFDTLRLGCEWDGAASMAVELLTHMGIEAQKFLSRKLMREESVEPLFYFQRESLRIVSILHYTLPSHPSAYQHSTYAACASLAMRCYLVEVCSSMESGIMGAPVLAVPGFASRVKQVDYLLSASTALLDLVDSMAIECQKQHLSLVLSISLAAVTASGIRSNNNDNFFSCIFSRLEKIFSSSGLLISNPIAVMHRFSSLSGNDCISCGALWLFMVLLTGLFPDMLEVEAKNHNVMMMTMSAEVDKWVVAALPTQRRLLWDMLASPFFQAYISLVPLLIHPILSAMVSYVANIPFSYPESHDEAVSMLRFLYSRMWHDDVIEATAQTLANKLLSFVLQFNITTVTPADIAESCSDNLALDDVSEDVIVVLGASSILHPENMKLDLLEQLLHVTPSCRSTGNSLHARSSGIATSRLILTLDAVIALVEISSSNNNDAERVKKALEVLSWLESKSTSGILFQQVLVIAPNTCGALLQTDFARERRHSVMECRFKDGVRESCAIARCVADKLRNPAQSSRVTVFFADNDHDGAEYAEARRRHTLLLRHGVRSLSRRREKVKRAKADVMDILRDTLHSGIPKAHQQRDQIKIYPKYFSARGLSVGQPFRIRTA